MSDYINRQDVIKALTEANLQKHMDSVKDGGQINRSAIRIIMGLPSADVVEVVRCKDCRYGKERCGNIECETELHGYGWFCPIGKQKDDDMIGEKNE